MLKFTVSISFTKEEIARVFSLWNSRKRHRVNISLLDPIEPFTKAVSFEDDSNLLRLRVTQKALQLPLKLFFFLFFFAVGVSVTDWQKLFVNFCFITALGTCHQDRTY